MVDGRGGEWVEEGGSVRWGMEGLEGGGAQWRVTFLLAFFGESSRPITAEKGALDKPG